MNIALVCGDGRPPAALRLMMGSLQPLLPTNCPMAAIAGCEGWRWLGGLLQAMKSSVVTYCYHTFLYESVRISILGTIVMQTVPNTKLVSQLFCLLFAFTAPHAGGFQIHFPNGLLAMQTFDKLEAWL